MLIDENILKISTGNWADYNSIKDFVTCGWMDFHSDEDYGCTKELPMMTIKVHWVNELEEYPVLVYSNDGKLWNFEEIQVGKSYTFNGYNYHALIPFNKLRLLPKYTKKLVGSPIWKQMIKLAEIPTTPKIIWTWEDAYDNK